MSVRVEFRWDEELVARVDAAKGVGQPRADWVRRAVERELEIEAKVDAYVGAVEQVSSEAQEPTRREQAGPGSVPSSEGVRPAAPAEQPHTLAEVDEVLKRVGRTQHSPTCTCRVCS